MNREDLVALCELFAGRRAGVVMGRLRGPDGHETLDPVPEILRSFHRAEISESEKNSLLSLVCDSDEVGAALEETACIRDPFADEQPPVADED